MTTVANPGGSSSERTMVFNRPPRIRARLPVDTINVATPPAAAARPQNVNILGILTPILILLVSGVTVLQVTGANRALTLIGLVGMTAVSIIGGLGNLLWERRDQARSAKHENIGYKELLEKQRRDLQILHDEQQRKRNENDPNPLDLVQIARNVDTRLWERRPTDDDFLRVRLGIGEQASTVTVVPPRTENAGPELAEALALAEEYGIVRGVPVTIGLTGVGSLGIVGRTDRAAAMLRSVLVNFAVHHAPDDLRIAAVVPPDSLDDWAWLTELPHCQPLQAESQLKVVASSSDETDRLLLSLLNELSRRERRPESTDAAGENRTSLPHVVLVLIGREGPLDHVTTGYILRRGREIGASVICLVSRQRYLPGDVGAIVEVTGEQANIAPVATSDPPSSCVPDHLDLSEVDSVGAALRNLRLRGTPGTGDLRRGVRLLPLVGIDLRTFDPLAMWSKRKTPSLSLPIGEAAGDLPLVFDLETQGPHGIIAGTTGSGKSELLQTMIVGLALANSPKNLSFVLVDYKGGGSLGVFRKLPHCVGLITNLDRHLTERALTAFQVELKRRQRAFAEADNARDIYQYRNRRPAAVMPNLVIVIDEFAELARELPDLMDRLVSIAQTGRSLGVHLILATQRPSGVVNANIWANVRFRICLRVESLEDSRDVLGRPDAALIPHTLPGRGYFQVGQSPLQLFQTARVAAGYEGALPATLADLSPDGADTLALEPSDADVTVALLAESAKSLDLRAVPRPWSEPLGGRVTLAELFQRLGWTMEQSDDSPWHWPELTRDRRLRVPIAMVDDLNGQRLSPLMLNLLRTTHVLIAGSAGAGKSTLVRTIVVSLAVTHDPSRLWFYLVDLGSQALAPLRDLPQVAGYFRSNETARIQRLTRRLRAELDRRKVLEAESAIATPTMGAADQRESRPRIVVVIDGLASFREEFEDDFSTLTAIARDGKAVGIHLVLTIDRPSAVPGSLLSNVELRLALRLTDPLESGALINGDDAAGVSVETPGRGFYNEGQRFEFQAALTTDGPDDDARVIALVALVKNLQRSWSGPEPERVELLPTQVSLIDLWRRSADETANGHRGRLAVPVALDDQSLSPVEVDLSVDGPHLLVLGMVGSGKTTVLRTWARALAHRFSHEDVQFALIGLRRSLRGLRRLPHLMERGYAENVTQLNDLATRLADEYERRREDVRQLVAANPDADTEFRASGPDIVIFLDDVELALMAASGATSTLAEVARSGRDLGIHLVVAGNSDEIIRSHGFEPLIQQLRAGRAGVLLRVSDPGDGQTLGVRLPFNIRLFEYPPGRAHLVTNTDVRLVQFATSEPAAASVGLASRV